MNNKYKLRKSNFFIRINNYMPLVYDCKYLYLHQVKGVLEFKPSKKGAAIFETFLAINMTLDLQKMGYEKHGLKAIDMYE